MQGILSDETIRWFNEAFDRPTPVQLEAWPAIASGGHTLISAPTGTGKTLSAFLVFIDQIARGLRSGAAEDRAAAGPSTAGPSAPGAAADPSAPDRAANAGALQLIYVSPLKSLAGDIRENLDKPLKGIAALEGGGRAGAGRIRVALRTGDTPANERRRMLKDPPHILLTTPESLYLLLTGMQSRKMLRSARAIVIDELHALAGGKRGAHLMLSVARLDALHGSPLQRIGLSATIRPLEAAAAYLSPGGVAGDVHVVAPKMEKRVELSVISPFEGSGSDMGGAAGGAAGGTAHGGERGGAAGGAAPEGSVWPQIARLVFMNCEGARTAIAFVEGRMHAEKLAHYVNEIAGEGFARTHHGSVSKEARLEAEGALREGKLRLLCATSSMELGIDVGEIDRTLQIGCPRTVSSAMQRLGRAGHNPGRVSAMLMFPRMAAEALACGLTAQLAREGGIERLRPPEQCLDILAQHLVSMAATGSYAIDDVMATLSRAQPFRSVTRAQAEATLRMLAGDFEHAADIPVRPRVLYDRVNGRVNGDPYSRLLALSAGGTIPDKGLFTARAQNGAKIGELDEEFVFEARVGDKFLLGSFAWRIDSIDKNEVRVSQASPEGAAPPFWKGEGPGRQIETGLAFGAIMRSLAEDAAAGKAELGASLARLGLDGGAVEAARGLLTRQLEAVGALADDRTIVVEHFRDEAGDSQWLAHSVFGRRVNAPLAHLAAEAARRATGMEMGIHDDDDGFLLFPYGEREVPPGILASIDAATARRDLAAMLVSTPLFNMAFRYNAARALMMGARRAGRLPLWIQRLRAARMLDAAAAAKGHPLIEETRRECLSDYWDLDGVEYVLDGIRRGTIRVREAFRETPSPMSLALRRAAEAVLMYEYSPTTAAIARSGEDALAEARAQLAADGGEDGRAELDGAARRAPIDGSGMLDEAARMHESRKARQAQSARAPIDEWQLHALLMAEGDQQAGEVRAPIEWFEALALQGRALYIEPGLWIAAEHAEEYASAGEADRAQADGADGTAGGADGAHADGADGTADGAPAGGADGAKASAECMQRIARRALRSHGCHTAEELATRYHWPLGATECALAALCRQKAVVAHGGAYYHADLFDSALRAVAAERRAGVRTMPAERYAALLAARVARGVPGPPSEQLEAAIASLCGASFPAALWESVLLPARVPHYRPTMLDSLLSSGAFCWQYDKGGVSFTRHEDIDWDSAPAEPAQASLTADERVVIDALASRGALFMQGISAALGGRSPYDALAGLVEKGLVRSDSFAPIRRLAEQGKESLARATVRQRAQARAGALSAGRWELTRAAKPPSIEAQLMRAFDRVALLCRETAAGVVQWDAALRALRVWEYTGRARRGYYIDGLSGAQFIRSEDHAAAAAEFARPQDEIVWLSGADVAQQWGKSLAHRPGRSFTNVPGVAVGLRAGLPVAVFERHGQALRALPEEGPPRDLSDELIAFARQFARRRIYPSQKNVAVRQFPEGAAEALLAAGFAREPSGYVLFP